METYEKEESFCCSHYSSKIGTVFKTSKKDFKTQLFTPAPKHSPKLTFDSLEFKNSNHTNRTNDTEWGVNYKLPLLINLQNNDLSTKERSTPKYKTNITKNSKDFLMYDQVLQDLRLSLRSENPKQKQEDTAIQLPQQLASSYTNTEIASNFYEYTENCMRLIVKIKKRKQYISSKITLKFNIKEKKLALFDLDETLIHCTNGKEKKGDHTLLVTLPGNKKVTIGINIRPYWKEMIKTVREKYYIVVYTASHQSYADAVLDYLDPEHQYFNDRLYRRHCIQEEIDEHKFYIKDMEIFEGIDIKDIIIIDNSVLSFAYHLDSGVSIIPFYDNKNDCEMLLLSHYLLSIYSYDDLRAANREHIQLSYFYNQAKKEYEEEITKQDTSSENNDKQEEENDNSNETEINLIICNRNSSNKGTICADFQKLLTNLRMNLKTTNEQIIVE